MTDEEQEKAYWVEHRKRLARNERVLALVQKLTSKSFVEALRVGMNDEGVYFNRIVRYRQIGYQTKNNQRGAHKTKREDDTLPWNHTFVLHKGGYEDSYWGDVWFPLGRGKYLFCGYLT